MKTPAEISRFSQLASILRNGRSVNERCLMPLYKPLAKQNKKGRGRSSRFGKFGGRGKRGRRCNRPHRIRHCSSGGNVPFYRQVRKTGLARMGKMEPPMTKLTLCDIQQWIDRGNLDPDRPIDMSLLVRAKLIESCQDGVLLEGSEEDTTFNSKITITVSKASLEAIRLVESFGGKIETRYHSMEERLMMSAPLVFLNRPRPPPLMPTRQKLRDYYTNPLNRGYLAYTQRPKTNLFKDSHLMNQKYVPLPEHLSMGKPLVGDKEDNVIYRNILEVPRDYNTRYEDHMRWKELLRKGDSQYAAPLLSADAVKETAV